MSADGSLSMEFDHSEWLSGDAFERIAPIRFGRETCGDLQAAERREWWIGNGRGAYAAGTVALTLTRRYHGLLIAPIDPPLGRALVFANGRDHHGETWAPGFAPEIAVDDGALIATVQDRFALCIQAPGGAIAPQHDWIDNFDLPLERERGLSDRDCHLCVGRAEVPLAIGVWHGVVASVEPEASPDISAALERRRAHDRRVIDRAIAADPVFANAPGWVMRLVLASDLYVIARPVPELEDGRSVIAGYAWFGGWGGDAMSALP